MEKINYRMHSQAGAWERGKSVQFYAGYEMALNDTIEGTEASETLNGSSRGETLRSMGGRDILDAGAGRTENLSTAMNKIQRKAA